MSGNEASLDNIIFSGSYTIEGGRIKKKPPCYLFRSEPLFERIWTGGVVRGTHLALKLQLSEDKYGQLLYNGKLYNRDSWTWRPPKFVRLQGRLAKEYTDPRNFYPTDEIDTEDGHSIRIRAKCRGIKKPCGGELLYDKLLFLYCIDCGLIRESPNSNFTLIHIHETDNAPMSDHDLSRELDLEKKWTALGLKYI